MGCKSQLFCLDYCEIRPSFVAVHHHAVEAPATPLDELVAVGDFALLKAMRQNGNASRPRWPAAAAGVRTEVETSAERLQGSLRRRRNPSGVVHPYYTCSATMPDA